jgi:site-specific DNA-cytosine methylase
LAGRPEEGDTGDLFLYALQFAAHHMPKACVFENVPNFGESVAGKLLKTSLAHLGYSIYETTLEPHKEWNEPSDRRRWICIATLSPGFCLEIPNTPFQQSITSFLDEENNLLDEIDAKRIANTIEGLKRHNARHSALGHGFAMTTISRDSTKIPTIPKSYHKINTGPFLETPHGLRLLRLHEVEHIMGAKAYVDNYSTGIQILGQGVQTRIWKNILSQLGEFLNQPLHSKLPAHQMWENVNVKSQTVTSQTPYQEQKKINSNKQLSLF